jgi:hypothetical protein
MKYSSGQKVTLLDTEFKPAGSAVIRGYEETSNKYEVEFTYPDRQTVDNISVPEERLVLLTEFFNQ